MTDGLAKLEVLLQLNDKLTMPVNKIQQRVGRMNDRFVRDTRNNTRAIDKFSRTAQTRMTGMHSVMGRTFDGMNRRLTGATNRVRAFGREATNMLGNVIPGFGQLQGLIPAGGSGLGVIGGGLLAGAAVGGISAVKGARFDNSFLQLRLLNLDRSRTEMDALRERILDEAGTRGLKAQQVGQAVYDIQSGTGIFGNPAVDIAGRVGKFAQYTQADFGQVMNSVIKTMRAFQLEAGDTDRILNNMFKTVQVGITDFNQLSRVQSEYMGTAAQVGQTLESANKLFAAFSAVSKDSNIAATQTKVALEGLTQINTQKGLKSIGVNVFDANNEVRQLDELVADLIPKFQQMSDFEFNSLINAIGGSEGLRGLLGQIRTQGEGLLTVFEQFDSSTFNIDRAAEVAEQDAVIRVNQELNRLNTVLTDLGVKTLPGVVKGINMLSDSIRILNEMIPYDLISLGKGRESGTQEEIIDDSFAMQLARYFGWTNESAGQSIKTPGNLPQLNINKPLTAAEQKAFFQGLSPAQLQAIAPGLTPTMMAMLGQQQAGTGGGGIGGDSTPTPSGGGNQAFQGIVRGGQKVQHLTVNIDALVNELTIQAQTMERGMDEGEEVVREALIRAVRNVERAY